MLSKRPFLLFFSILFSVFFFLLSPHPESLHAQLTHSVDVTSVVSTGNTTPFWLQSNRHGVISGKGSQIFIRSQHHGRSDLSEAFTLNYGADLVGRAGRAPTLWFNQAYLRLEAYGMYLSGGRFHNTSPLHDEELGMGSLGVSGNAVPIPQIRAGLSDWTPLPLTHGFIELKGHMAHGWLGSRRHVEGALYHEKVGHVRLGGSLPVNLYGGIAHYALWGGKNPDPGPDEGDFHASFQDFLKVFIAREGAEDSPEGAGYALGDHLGAWDFGLFVELDDIDIHIYRQFPLETRDNVKLKSWMDALTGISFTFGDNLNFPVTRFVYEYLYTKHQDGVRRFNTFGDGKLCIEHPGACSDRYRGNENYYNHGVYRTGWVYDMRTIGNALFTPGESNLGVLNNRIVAHHIGVRSDTGVGVLTGKVTFSRNYGKRCHNNIPVTEEESEIFRIECENEVENIGGRSIDQWSFLLGIQTPVTWNDQSFTITLETSFDNGALAGDQFGILTGIRFVY